MESKKYKALLTSLKSNVKKYSILQKKNKIRINSPKMVELYVDITGLLREIENIPENVIEELKVSEKLKLILSEVDDISVKTEIIKTLYNIGDARELNNILNKFRDNSFFILKDSDRAEMNLYLSKLANFIPTKSLIEIYNNTANFSITEFLEKKGLRYKRMEEFIENANHYRAKFCNLILWFLSHKTEKEALDFLIREIND